MKTILWLFFASVILVVVVGTHRAIVIQEGVETKDDCKNTWIHKCLDISGSKIQNYEMYSKIVNYLTMETNDIKSRANIKFSLDPVSMKYVNPTRLQDPNSAESKSTVDILGQVPNLRIRFQYPEPLQGIVGPTGEKGPTGDVGPEGPMGSQGLPGYSHV